MVQGEKPQMSRLGCCKHIIAEGSLRPTALREGMGFGRTGVRLDKSPTNKIYNIKHSVSRALRAMCNSTAHTVNLLLKRPHPQ